MIVKYICLYTQSIGNGGETLDIPLNVIVLNYYFGGAFLENKSLMVIDFTSFKPSHYLIFI
jgi:hypothetical protein